MKTHACGWLGALLVSVLMVAGCDREQTPSGPSGETSSPPSATQDSVGAAPAPLVPSPIEALASVAPLTESVRSAVVNVEVRARVPGFRGGPPGLDPWGGLPFPPWLMPGPRSPEPLRQGLGSGFIIDAKGLVLTNNHVVEGAVDIQVQLVDGRPFPAEVLGTDPLTDVALLRLQGEGVKDLPVVRLGDSDAMRVGDWVWPSATPSACPPA